MSTAPRGTANEAATNAALDQERVCWIRTQQGALWRYLRLLGARAHEVEDLMQDAFVVLFSRYADHEPASQVRLLHTIARNRLLEVRRRHRGDERNWTDAVDSWVAQHPDVLADQHSEHVAACLRELAPRARAGLTMRHVDGQSIEHVAHHLGLQRSGALTLLQRSRDLLRSCLRRRGIRTTQPPSPATDRSCHRIQS